MRFYNLKSFFLDGQTISLDRGLKKMDILFNLNEIDDSEFDAEAFISDNTIILTLTNPERGVMFDGLTVNTRGRLISELFYRDVPLTRIKTDREMYNKMKEVRTVLRNERR